MPVNLSDEATPGERTMNLELSAGDAPTASLGHPIDSSKIAYQLPQPMGMVPDTLMCRAKRRC